MSLFITPFVTGIAVMAVLVAGASYVSPPLRCISERGTVFVSEPIGHCYKVSQFMPEGALEAAK